MRIRDGEPDTSSSFGWCSLRHLESRRQLLVRRVPLRHRRSPILNDAESTTGDARRWSAGPNEVHGGRANRDSSRLPAAPRDRARAQETGSAEAEAQAASIPRTRAQLRRHLHTHTRARRRTVRGDVAHRPTLGRRGHVAIVSDNRRSASFQVGRDSARGHLTAVSAVAGVLHTRSTIIVGRECATSGQGTMQLGGRWGPEGPHLPSAA
jgi:hypothetical protein